MHLGLLGWDVAEASTRDSSLLTTASMKLTREIEVHYELSGVPRETCGEAKVLLPLISFLLVPPPFCSNPNTTSLASNFCYFQLERFASVSLASRFPFCRIAVFLSTLVLLSSYVLHAPKYIHVHTYNRSLASIQLSNKTCLARCISRYQPWPLKPTSATRTRRYDQSGTTLLQLQQFCEFEFVETKFLRHRLIAISLANLSRPP